MKVPQCILEKYTEKERIAMGLTEEELTRRKQADEYPFNTPKPGKSTMFGKDWVESGLAYDEWILTETGLYWARGSLL